MSCRLQLLTYHLCPQRFNLLYVCYPITAFAFRNYGTRQESRPWKQRPNRRPRLTLILSDDVPRLGSKGDMVHVKRGYGRNFLLPKGKAVYPSQENLKLYNVIETPLKKPRRGTAKIKVEKKLGGPEFIVSFLADKKVIIEQDEKEDSWRIYEQHISSALRRQLQLHVPMDCIELSEPFTKYGKESVLINIDESTQAMLPVEIIPLPDYKKKHKEKSTAEIQ